MLERLELTNNGEKKGISEMQEGVLKYRLVRYTAIPSPVTFVEFTMICTHTGNLLSEQNPILEHEYENMKR